MKTHLIKTVCTLLLAVTCLISCKKETKNTVSDEAVLKIDNLIITKYEFEKNKERYFQAGTNYKKWINEFIEESYFLADAYNKKYDTLAKINTQLYYTSIAMISKVDGYLWERDEKPKLQFSNSEIKDVYKKRNQVFYMEYLWFPTEESIIETLGKNTIETETDFIRASNITRSKKGIILENRAFTYPFDELFDSRNYIFAMEEGQISEPLKAKKGFFIVHLIQKEETKQKDYKVDKKRIVETLKAQKTQELITQKQSEVYSETAIRINNNNCQNIVKCIETNKFGSFEKDTLAVYDLNNKQEVILVQDFQEYLTNSPFISSGISDSSAVKQTIKDLVIQKYNFFNARNTGILDDIKYQLDEKNYCNKLILNEYLNNEVFSKANVNETELQDYYQKISKEKALAEECTITTYTFKTEQGAYGNIHYIDKLLNEGKIVTIKDSTHIFGMKKCNQNILVKPNDNNLPASAIQQIFSAPINKIYGPFQMDDDYVLFLKTEERGSRIAPLDEIKEELVFEIKQMKLASLKTELLNELKNKYVITENKITNL
jgi:hypothetical protein